MNNLSIIYKNIYLIIQKQNHFYEVEKSKIYMEVSINILI